MSRSTPPSVGRIVHYRSHGTPIRPDGSQAFTGECRAAIVTEVETGPRGEDGVIVTPTTVGLCVLNPTGQFFHPLDAGGCAHDEDEKLGGTWHWPEHVEPEGLVRESPVPDPLARGGMIDRPLRTPDSTIGGAP